VPGRGDDHELVGEQWGGAEPVREPGRQWSQREVDPVPVQVVEQRAQRAGAQGQFDRRVRGVERGQRPGQV